MRVDWGRSLVLFTLAAYVLASCGNDCSNHGVCVQPGYCTCSSGWGGEDCSVADQLVVSGTTLDAHLETYSWQYYHIVTGAADEGLLVEVTQTSDLGDIDLYLGLNSYPTTHSYIYKDSSSTSRTMSAQINDVREGTYYVGLYGYWAADYEIFFSLTQGCAPACEHGNCINHECVCDTPYIGTTCTIFDQEAVSGVQYHGSVTSGEYHYYHIDVEAGKTLDIVLTQALSTADLDLFVKKDARPTYFQFTYDDNGIDQTSIVHVEDIEAGLWEIGVYGFIGCDYNITTTVSDHVPCMNDCSGENHGVCIGGACTCYADYSGSYCNTYDDELLIGTYYPGNVDQSFWNYWHIDFFTSSSLSVTLTQLQGGDCDLYIRNGAEPSITMYDLVDWSTRDSVSLVINQPGTDTWYVGVYGYHDCLYTLLVNEVVQCQCGSGSHGSCPEGSTECVCEIGWAGVGCTQVATPILSGQVLNYQHVQTTGWKYYYMIATTSYASVTMVETDSAGLLWLYVGLEGYTTLENFEYSDTSEGSFHEVHVQLGETMQQAFFIGVYGNSFGGQGQDTEFQLTAWYPDFI